MPQENKSLKMAIKITMSKQTKTEAKFNITKPKN